MQMTCVTCDIVVGLGVSSSDVGEPSEGRGLSKTNCAWPRLCTEDREACSFYPSTVLDPQTLNPGPRTLNAWNNQSLSFRLFSALVSDVSFQVPAGFLVGFCGFLLFLTRFRCFSLFPVISNGFVLAA